MVLIMYHQVSYYASGVNYHADGLANESKRTHLNTLHNILIQYQDVLLYDNIQYCTESYTKPTEIKGEYWLNVDTCKDKASSRQQWTYDSKTKLSQLESDTSKAFCVTGIISGDSYPVELIQVIFINNVVTCGQFKCSGIINVLMFIKSWSSSVSDHK